MIVLGAPLAASAFAGGGNSAAGVDKSDEDFAFRGKSTIGSGIANGLGCAGVSGEAGVSGIFRIRSSLLIPFANLALYKSVIASTRSSARYRWQSPIPPCEI